MANQKGDKVDMKAKRKFYLYLIITIAFVYISLLAILYCSESSDSNAMSAPSEMPSGIPW